MFPEEVLSKSSYRCRSGYEQGEKVCLILYNYVLIGIALLDVFSGRRLVFSLTSKGS